MKGGAVRTSLSDSLLVIEDGDISGGFQSHHHEPMGAEPTTQPDHDAMAGQMEWLEALFGDYLDPDLIIHPQS